VFIGFQAAGKSTFCAQRFADTHVVVSKDALRNNRRPERRQRELIAEALEEGRSVVVDNTNPSKAERAGIIETVRAASPRARIIGYLFTSSLTDCRIRNTARPERTRVPDVGFFAAAKRYEAPSISEGFDELWAVATLPDFHFEVTAYEEVSSASR